MAISETLKSYLVSLGYEVDSSAYTKFVSTLKQTQSVVERHTNILSSSFAKAGLAYTGAIGTIIATTATMLNSLAKADMEYEKTALRLHMTTQAAKQYSTALKVLGEPPEMLAWMPELHEYYVQLRKDAMQMELPEEYSKRMQMIRGVGQEFNRLKQESIYALQWIGFSVVKHLQGPLEKSKFTFESFNRKIIESMPRWTEKIGKTIANIMQIFGNVGKTIAKLGEGLVFMWDSLSPTAKGLAAIALITFLFSRLGPFGQAMILLAAVTLLLSEFWSMLEGKETLIPREILQGLIMALDTLYRSMMTIIVLAKSFWASLSGPGAALVKEQFAKANYETAQEGWNTVKKATIERMIKEGKSTQEISNFINNNPSLKAQKEQVGVLKRKYETALAETNASDTDVVMKGLAEVREIWTPGSEKYAGPLGWMVKEHPKGFWSSEEAHAETIRQEIAAGVRPPAAAASVSGVLSTALPKNIEQYQSIIEEASALHGVPANLIAAMMWQESRGKKGAVSPVGAMGLMQIMPGTAKELGIPLSELTDPRRNIFGGAEYMSKKLKETKGDIPTALAAYNAGFGAVQKYKGQIPPYRETQDYVKQIMANYQALGGGAGNNINSGNVNNVSVVVSMPIENAGGDLEKNSAQLVAKLQGQMQNSFRELFMPGFTVSDSSGMMPGPVVNQLSVPSVSGG